MEPSLTSAQQEIRETILKVCAAFGDEYWLERDRDGEFPHAFHRAIADGGWDFPYVSTNGSDFPFDFGLALTEEQALEIPEVKEMIENPPEWLEFWSTQVGAELKDGLREAPGYIAFARENGTVYHTYTVTAPDPFVAPFFNFLLDRTPKPQPEDPLSYRKDEYPE